MKSLLSQLGLIRLKIKIIAFVFGAITASIAGSLQAGFIGFSCTERLHFHQLNQCFDIVVFGGLGSITGAIVSAIALEF